MSLIERTQPPAPDGITLIHGDAMEAIRAGGGARLVLADPPWPYSNTGSVDRGFNGCAAGVYETPSMESIIAMLDASFDSAADDAYLLTWCTWPTMHEWLGAGGTGPRWRYLTGGCWQKTGGLGVGFHVRGDSEPWLLWAKGKPKPTGTLSNAWASPRTKHSEKPVGFLVAAMEALTQPGDLVLSVYSGLCPEARAAKKTGRRLVGAELDHERWGIACGLLAGAR